MSPASDSFQFAEEVVQVSHLPTKTWKVLSVEDNDDYQNALVSSLKALILPNHIKLEILTADSAYSAAAMLNTHKDIGLILLDVVMEEDDTGLKLVKLIREELGNALVRIVLLTGQPGFAPEKDVMSALDIDEYWNKADLTLDKLHSVVTSNLRTWNYVFQVEESRQGLKLVLDAAKNINCRYDLPSFTRTVLVEIGHIIGIKKGGIFCMGDGEHPIEETQVITATGCFTELEGLALSNLQLKTLHSDIHEAIAAKTHIIKDNQSVFYFETNDINEKYYLFMVNAEQPLSEAHINLLKVFNENVSSGFTNIALLNRVTELAYTHVDLNIPNRNWLKKEIQNMNRQEWRQTRLLMLEIKHFDDMKFTFGYEFIQNVLSFVYQRLHQLLPTGTRVALTGHKQFSVLLDSDIEISAELVKQLTYNEIEVKGVAHATSFTLLNMHLDIIVQSSTSKIISMAESVLKEASHNHSAYVIYTEKETNLISRRYRLMGELRDAIRERALTVMLQPKINLTTGNVVGFEALARWQRDDGSFVPPDEFIAIAETAGLINKLDCLIFEKTLEALKQLFELDYRIPIAFNASSYDLLNQDYYEFISRCLKTSGLPAELLELEVTESQAIADYDRIKDCLQRFEELGIKISIDDFGTGYSSLAHISNITAHCIKIDRGFICDLENDISSQHVVNMILSLGKKFNFIVVAEGIETDYQQQWLRDMGCDVGQGYLFSKPMFTDDIVSWLTANQQK
jgi:EAL domain-containing protein (putative c-di-GMP-specific phosphodiesterase class I)/GGDEF domain-containing protein/CheY-like chemotaxis protein